MNKENKLKRLVVDMAPKIHADIKIHAARRNITIKKWVIRAITEALIREQKYE